jgi:murein DD-endopeptidase MepM/ murein hydrolase activator NlpD
VDPKARGREALHAFFAEDPAAFAVLLSEAERQRHPRAELDAQHAQLLRKSGTLDRILRERTPPSLGAPGTTVYIAKVRLTQAPQTFSFEAVFDPSGQLLDYALRSDAIEAATPYLDYVPKAGLRLPFDGHWTVVWGGRTLADNYHAELAQQRFAYDLLVKQDGVTHRGAGDDNRDYFAFDQPVLAAAEGTVVEAVDGIADNRPGEMNTVQVIGNHVVLDHGQGEFSLYAHLRQGSLQVRVGDHLAAGAELGRCGNSGHSSEPHLHFQLQDSGNFDTTRSLPAPFSHLQVDGHSVEKAELIRGQVVSPE